jgi:PST family polysaccharide transporter
LLKFSKDNSIILKNLSFLTILRGFNIGIKFLLVAYLVRVLGEINYGIYTWTDSVIQYFLVFINFGFNVYAAKYIVDNKGSKSGLNDIISSIFIIKLIFFFASCVILLFLTYLAVFQPFRDYLLLLLLMGIGEVFFPIWYFQGIEKLNTATYITVFARLLLLLGTFFLVTNANDLNLYILLIVASNIIMGLLGYTTLVRQYSFSFIWVSVKTIKRYLKEAYMFFLGGFLSLTFNALSIFLIGLYYTMDYVTGFDVALKIVLVCIVPFDMLQQAVFPTISRNKNKVVLKKLITISVIVGVLFTLALNVFSIELLTLFGGSGMEVYGDVLKALSPIPPIVAISFLLGTCTLVAFDYNKEFNQSLIISSLFYILVIVILVVFDKMTFWNLVYLRVFSDIVLLSIRLYFTLKNRILSTN